MEEKDLAFFASLGFSFLARGAVEESQPIFKLLASQLPNDAAGPIGLASIEIFNGNYAAAIQMLQDGPIHAEVNAHEARRVLLNALIFSNRMTEAGELHRSLMQFDAGNMDAAFMQQADGFFQRDQNRAA